MAKEKYYLQVNKNSGSQINTAKKNYAFEVEKQWANQFEDKKSSVYSADIRKVTYDEMNRPYQDELYKKVYRKD